MNTVVSNPGKFGDIIWSLATARAISQHQRHPVIFIVSWDYRDIVPLIAEQPYILSAHAEPTWILKETGPCAPRIPEELTCLTCHDIVATVHLGYAGWPIGPTLPESHYKMAREQLGVLPPLDLDTPWITSTASTLGVGRIHVGWNIMYPELKMGLTYALAKRFPDRTFNLVLPREFQGRYDEWNVGGNIQRFYTDWLGRAAYMMGADVFFGCLSGQWALANAMGKKTVIMEPAAGRNDNPLFWLDRPRNHLVRGNDGRATDNSLHCGDMLEMVLNG